MKKIEDQVVEISPWYPETGRGGSVRHVLIIALLAACVVSFVVRAHSNRERAETSHAVLPIATTKPSPMSFTQAKQTPVTISGLGVIVTRRGFHPAGITRPPGRFILSVINRTGLDTLSFALDSPSGAPVREKQLAKEEPQWAEAYSLAPGRYVLRETSHPTWACEIVIK